jgi:hypothetical protein
MSNEREMKAVRCRKAALAFRTCCVLFVLWPVLTMAEDKHVDVTVRQEGGVNKLVFLNSECPDRPNESGCVTADRGNSPNISWQLDSSAAGAWVFSRLQFSPDGVHWGDPSHPLKDCTVSDFGLDEASRGTGHVSSAQILGNGRMLQIHDANRDTCTTHYRLYAAPAGGGMEIDSDPIIDNRGGGGRN